MCWNFWDRDEWKKTDQEDQCVRWGRRKRPRREMEWKRLWFIRALTIRYKMDWIYVVSRDDLLSVGWTRSNEAVRVNDGIASGAWLWKLGSDFGALSMFREWISVIEAVVHLFLILPVKAGKLIMYKRDIFPFNKKCFISECS